MHRAFTSVPMQEGFAAEHCREVLGHPVHCAGLLSQLFVASFATIQASILLLVLQRDYRRALLIRLLHGTMDSLKDPIATFPDFSWPSTC